MASNSALLDNETTLNFGEEDDLDREKRLKHPVAVFFHLFFRSLALLSYLMCGFFSSSFITNFVIVVLLLCMDFWTVKNVTGRLLVGLRWWNYVDDKGESHWVYESRKGNSGTIKISAAESRIFWLSLVISEGVWVFFLVATIFTFSFKWIMVSGVGLMMNGANLYGYIRCKYGAKKSLSSVATGFLSTQMFRSMLSSAASAATTPATPAPQATPQPPAAQQFSID